MKRLAMFSRIMRYVGCACLLLLMVGCTADSLKIVPPSEGTEPHAAPTEPAMAGDQTPSERQSPLLGTGGYDLAGPYPASLDEFLKGRDLIVLAKLGDVEYMTSYGYDPETGEPVESIRARDLGILGISAADFILEVEQVLWADETFRPDAPVILRVLWADKVDDEGIKEWKASFIGAGLKPFETGDRYLFILDRNPDGTYGVTYDEHRLTVDENGVLYYSQMYPPYPVKVGEFREGERYGETKGPPLTVNDLVRAAEAWAEEPGARKSDLNGEHYTIYLPLTPAQ